VRCLSVRDASTRGAVIREAVRVLRGGGIVAFPTETVYGLCVEAGSREAVERLFALKGRDARRACAYLLADRDAAESYVGSLPPFARRIADHHWPGPVTLVVPGREGSDMVGLRLPEHPAARLLASQAGRPLLQTSANRSGEPAALNASGVIRALGDSVDLILDGGRAPGGRSSTVVRCDDASYTVLRAGAVPADAIARAAARLILVACTGNICRSPLGEAMLRHATAKRLGCRAAQVALHGFRFGSFGTMAMPDHPATEHSVTVAAERGLDLRTHRSRTFSIALLEEAEQVYCMAKNHLEFLQPYFTGERSDALALLDPKGKQVHDPYGRSLKVYRKTAEQISKAVARRAEELVAPEEEEEQEEAAEPEADEG
jgi:tRNA threonylcarbamoyl adenosine modification protein (Sua5/YciO/YrdC/YwlC family)